MSSTSTDCQIGQLSVACKTSLCKFCNAQLGLKRKKQKQKPLLEIKEVSNNGPVSCN